MWAGSGPKVALPWDKYHVFWRFWIEGAIVFSLFAVPIGIIWGLAELLIWLIGG